VEALSKFLAAFKKKRPNMAAGEWFFHWDNVLVHTAAIVKDWMAARDFRLIDHPPYSPDLAPADFFLFPTIKRQLAGKTLTQETFDMMWEGPPGPSPKRTTPPPSGAGLSAARSASGLAADTLRNLEK
jgi:hypothetical protein